uniref:Putative ubiquitin domain-containing protein ubfd1 n=1 Tax=Triatoma dimidiata TaxID=72491 RepID=A0A0V0G4E3_TRIDM
MENAGEPLKSDENGEQPEKKFAPLEEKEERESVSHQQESPSSPACDGPKECVKFVVIHNKNKYDVEFPLDETIAKLKLHLQNLLGVPQSLQKVMYKGLAKDEKLLREIGITGGAKVMVVGSKLDDVLAVSTPNTQPASEEKSQSSSKEPLCKQKNHKKIVDRGVPEDVMPGILNTKEPLPPFPLCGMLNKSGGKVRLTFKLELDQLWIGSKERTEKIPMSTIKSIISEPIDGHEEYHIMGIQMGTTEASRYWFYWVPAQYIDSIKDAVLGPWVSHSIVILNV